MKPITPHLWFDKEAKEAAEFYTSLLPDSEVENVTTIHDTPSGDCDIVTFKLGGQPFMAISAGPLFKFNPSISFHLKCATPEEVDGLWDKLSPGGKVLMEIGSYPFSERYGWIQDKYGLSWQIIQVGEQGMGQRITPVLMFTKEVSGKAEEAMNFYASLFPNSNAAVFMRYPAAPNPDLEGKVQYGQFVLNGMEFGAMDAGPEHDFKFNEAISFIVSCATQEELDKYWEALSAVPESEQCGWCKDKYGLSWQIVPDALGEMMTNGTPEQRARVTQAFIKMKKFDIAGLKAAYEGA
jgi:predicted 3-demethylubiquinone-9 3-methyltransferase (glyoxalase superfamily)